MIEKKEDHLKDSEMKGEPQTDYGMVNPCWPPPARKPIKVKFEVDNLEGARVDVNIHMSEMEPVPYPYPPYGRMGEEKMEESPAPPEVATDE